MLSDSPNLDELALGLDGIFEGIQAGWTYIDMSTMRSSHITFFGKADLWHPPVATL